jgi:hypothetical protein
MEHMGEEVNKPSVSVLSPAEYRTWDNFVRESPQGCFFHTTPWINILSRHFKRPFKIFLLHWNDQPAGGCLVFEHRRFGQTIITPVPLYPYSAPLFYLPVDEKGQKTIANNMLLTSALLEFLNNRYRIWILDSSYLFTDMRAFQWAGCEVTPRYTYLLELKESHLLEEGYSPSLRKKIRQARERQPEVRESRDPQEFIRQYLASYRRHGIKALLSEEKLNRLLPDLLSLPEVKLFYLYFQETAAASRIIVVDQNTIYDLMAGSTDETGLGSAYLVSHIFEQYADQEYKFDFLGADQFQIEQFKRSFGGHLVHGFRVARPVRFPISFLMKIRNFTLQKERIL